MRADRSIETTHRVVYTLPSPCVWADVEAVFSAIRASGNASELRFDDSVTVEARDDEIRISFPTPDGPR